MQSIEDARRRWTLDAGRRWQLSVYQPHTDVRHHRLVGTRVPYHLLMRGNALCTQRTFVEMCYRSMMNHISLSAVRVISYLRMDKVDSRKPWTWTIAISSPSIAASTSHLSLSSATKNVRLYQSQLSLWPYPLLGQGVVRPVSADPTAMSSQRGRHVCHHRHSSSRMP